MNNQKEQVQSTKTERKKKRKFNRNNIILVIQVVVVMGLMGLFAAGGAAFGFVASVVKEQKVLSYEEMKMAISPDYITGFAYFSDGTPIGKLPTEQDRRLVTLKEISPYVIDALISTEDKAFYKHKGVSLRATARAVLQQITGSERQTGGSTLTQQLVKQTILEESFFRKEISGEVKGEELRKLKYKRKFNEIFLALRLERFFTKNQILEAYLNEMYFGFNASGSNIYGIQSAARGIFGVDAKDLNLPQAAYLVGMLQNPGYYIPFKEKGLEDGLKRMRLVLGQMKADGKITEAEYEEALKYDIKANLVKREETQSAYDKYPFLLFEVWEKAAKALVEDELLKEGYTLQEIYDEENKELYDELLEKKKRTLSTQGYNIYTTIDKELYDAFQEYAANPDHFWKNQTYTVTIDGKKKTIENAPQQLGAVLIDNRTGAILATIGGRDFNLEQTNHAFTTRQSGSTMKPILAYAPALEEGKLLSPESPVDDAPIVLNYGTPYEHTPRNYSDKFLGIMSAREALRQSWNIPAIRVYLDVGIPVALDYAKRMGITTLTEEDLKSQTGVIGGLYRGVSVEEMTNAYSTFANDGKFIDAYMVERIENMDGEVVYQHQVTSTPVFSEQTAYMVTDMLRTVYNEGTGRTVKQLVEKEHGRRDFAGKTGTTNNDKDLWFIGYSPNISLGVWTGFDIPYSMTKDKNTTRAKLIWAGLMNIVLDLKPDLSPPDLKFKQPDGLVKLEIDSKSGLLPSELSREAGHVITGLFRKDMVPTETDNLHVKARAVIIDSKTYLANEATPDDMVISKIFIKTPPLQFPTKMDKPLSYYLPADWLDRLPAETDPRTEDGKVPSTPTGLKATFDAAKNQVTLTWAANPEADIVGYRIYRSNGFSFDKIASVLNHEQKQYVDTSGNPQSGYYITAVDISGNESSPTQVASPTGGTEWSNNKPSVPTGVKATRGAAGDVDLSWNANPKEEQVIQYNIYYSESKDGPYELIASSTIDSYKHPNFNPTAGWYKISAVNHRGESELTAPFTVEQNEQDSNGNGESNPSNGNESGREGSEDGDNLIDIPIPPPGSGQ